MLRGPPIKVAAIGAGLAGLSAVWQSGRVQQVTLFERQEVPGFTAASVVVPRSLSGFHAYREVTMSETMTAAYRLRPIA